MRVRLLLLAVFLGFAATHAIGTHFAVPIMPGDRLLAWSALFGYAAVASRTAWWPIRGALHLGTGVFVLAAVAELAGVAMPWSDDDLALIGYGALLFAALLLATRAWLRSGFRRGLRARWPYVAGPLAGSALLGLIVLGLIGIGWLAAEPWTAPSREPGQTGYRSAGPGGGTYVPVAGRGPGTLVPFASFDETAGPRPASAPAVRFGVVALATVVGAAVARRDAASESDADPSPPAPRTASHGRRAGGVGQVVTPGGQV